MAAGFTPEQLQQLAGCLRATQVPATQKQAEAQLQQLDPHLGYPIALLQLVSDASVDPVTKQGAAITFKNFVRRRWRKEAEVSVADRAAIKTHILQLMLSAPPLVQKQLSDALAIISDADFPEKWPELLPEMIQKMAGGDWNIIKGVLMTLHSIFGRYRGLLKNNTVMTEQKYVLEQFAAPLLKLYQVAAELALNPATAANPLMNLVLFECLHYMTKIFYSLSFIDLPSQFEDTLKEWCAQFLRFLAFKSTAKELVGNDADKPGVLVKLQTAVCNVAVLYMEKYDADDEFLPHAPSFVNAIWPLVVDLPREQRNDRLVAASIAFINQVSLNSTASKAILANQSALQQICEKIIVPNVEFRQSDEELFEDDPQEYIKRDIEGSDSDTRRRAACELVRGLRKDYETIVTPILVQYISHLLQTYTADPKKNWKLKDACLYLVTALAVTSGTEGQGVTQANSLFDIVPFFEGHVMPELEHKVHAVLQADALKFATTFRRQLQKQGVIARLFPVVAHMLANPNVVVHSYAALCIERFLTLTDEGQPRYTKMDIAPHLQNYIAGFFKQLGTKESMHNEYIMRGLARVLLAAKEDTTAMAAQIIQGLCQLLLATAEHQVNANTTHYLFEAMGAVIKGVCTAQPQLVAGFVEVLSQPYALIMQKDLTDLSIYMFQLLALCLELEPLGQLSPIFTALFPMLLDPNTWQKAKSSIPALVRLLQAYIRKAGPAIGANKQLEGVLGVFQKLANSPLNDHEGFYLAESVVEYVPLESLQNFLPGIFDFCFKRKKSPKFTRNFITFFLLLVGKHGGVVAVHVIDKMEPGLTRKVLMSLILPTVQKVTGVIERKICAVGLTRLIMETPAFLTPDYLPLWHLVLTAIVRLFEEPPETSNPEEDAAALLEIDDEPGYSAAFAPLAFASKVDADPFKDIASAQVFLAQSLNRLSAQHPGQFGPIIAQQDRKLQEFLQKYIAAAGLPLPGIH